jgi:hypothetical protein
MEAPTKYASSDRFYLDVDYGAIGVFSPRLISNSAPRTGQIELVKRVACFQHFGYQFPCACFCETQSGKGIYNFVGVPDCGTFIGKESLALLLVSTLSAHALALIMG